MKQKEIKLFFDKFNSSGKFIFSEKRYVFFSPGLFLILLGVAVVLMPRLFLFFIAAFFLTIGLFACLLIWKFLQFKQKFDSLSKEFQGQVTVHGVAVKDVTVQGVTVEGVRVDNKKPRMKQTNFFEESLSGDLNLTDINTSRDTKKIIFH